MEPDLWQEYLNERATVVALESDYIDVEALLGPITCYSKEG